MIYREGWWINEAGESYDKPARLSAGKNTLAALSRKIRKRNYAIDCGAHYGTWTVPMSKMFKHVQAFEANTLNFKYLERNAGWIENVEIHNAALGNKFDYVNVDFVHETWHGNSGIKSVLGPGTTPMITIDSLECKGLDFLKIDVEGYEFHVLKGAEKTLKAFRPVILFEEIKVHCDRLNIRVGSCAKLLKSLGAKHRATTGNNFLYSW